MGVLPSFEAVGNPIRSMWDRLSPLPGGRTLYSRLIGRMAPYTGTIRAKVTELGEGHARVVMPDRPGIRNHLRSVHAVALFNLAELTGNAALGYSLPDDARFIPVAIRIEYLKKARGPITGTATCPVLESNAPQDIEVPVSMWNQDAVEVARAVLVTRVGPKKGAPVRA